LLLSLGFVYLLLQLPCLYWGWDLGMQVLGIGLQSLSQAFHACLGSIAQGLPSVCSFIHFPWFMVLISYAMLGLLVFLPTWRWRLALLLLALGSYQAYLYERLPTQAQLHALYSSKGPCFVWRKGRQAQVLLEHGAALDVAWQDRNLLPFLAYLGVKDTLSRAYASDKNLGIFLAGQRFVWVQKLQDMRLNEKPNALWLSPKYQRKKAPWWRPFQGIPLITRVGMVLQKLRGVDLSVVSTDHPKIAALGLQSGIHLHIRRPPRLSGDRIGDWQVLTHALLKAESLTGQQFDVVVMLQPTSPLRTPNQVVKTITRLIKKKLDSVWTVSIAPIKYHPLKSLVVDLGNLRFFDPKGKKILARQQ
ncbi:MAG: hypothetical protein EB038_10445, partial [Cyclobacteriaceae bacterium]|nr:hypothetical protein [Cyclobacteriaceae bacterium]